MGAKARKKDKPAARGPHLKLVWDSKRDRSPDPEPSVNFNGGLSASRYVGVSSEPEDPAEYMDRSQGPARPLSDAGEPGSEARPSPRVSAWVWGGLGGVSSAVGALLGAALTRSLWGAAVGAALFGLFCGWIIARLNSQRS